MRPKLCGQSAGRVLVIEIFFFFRKFLEYPRLPENAWRYSNFQLSIISGQSRLHQYGWSRENAVQYLMKNAAFSRDASEAEVDRYISLPGQAVSYKVGERKIWELRKKFVEDGAESLKDFHGYLLQCEGPLANVETCLNSKFKIISVRHK